MSPNTMADIADARRFVEVNAGTVAATTYVTVRRTHAIAAIHTARTDRHRRLGFAQLLATSAAAHALHRLTAEEA